MATLGSREPNPWADDLGLALRLARVAADIALDLFDRGVASELKGDGTPVTEADLAVEAALIDLLSIELSEDGVISEECGSRPGGRRRWILDPVDGTVNFAVGDPNWGTHIALEVDGELAVGIVTRPVAGETWWAVQGGGAFCSGGSSDRHRFQVSTVDTLADARVTMWPPDPGPKLDALQSSAGWVEPDWTLLKRLLEGELDAIVAIAGGIWDHAPAVLLTHEAGGRFSDHAGGSRLDGGGGIYSNGRLHEALKALLIFD